MKFVDIKNDIAFRKIFGNENKKEILISFLNAVLELPEGKKIKDVTFRNTYLLPEIKLLKSSIVDVKVTDQRNINYIVEMQVEKPEGFNKRVQYYAAKQYAGQIDKGEDYPKLNQVIFIGILNFNNFPGTDYITNHLTLNKKTLKQDLEDIEYCFVELLKFKKEETELVSLVDKWIYFIKHAQNLEFVPSNIDDEGLKHAYEDADKHNWTKEELDAYQDAEIRKQDEKGRVNLAVKEAVEKAIDDNTIEIAKEMIKENIPPNQICKITKLSMEIIETLTNELKNSH